MAQLDALKFDPDLDCSPARQPQQDEQRETLNEQARAARDAEQAAREAAQECGLCASGEHDFSSCTKCRLCKNDGHWAQDCPEARKVD